MGLNDGGVISLLPGMAIVVETEEEVDFPKSLFGLIVPKVSLLHEGVSNTTSKIDPGYHGHLYITIFNLGKRPIPLRKGQKICTLLLFRVDRGIRAYAKGSQSFRHLPATGTIRRTWSFLEANTGLLASLLLLANLVLILFTAGQCFQNRELRREITARGSASSTPPRGR
jgi:hypothetical protein